MKKRIISFLLTAVMVLTCTCVPFTAEEVSAGNTYSEMRLTDAVGEYLYYDLVIHDRAELGVSSVGFEVNYPDFLTLVSCEQEFSKGSFVTSETEDVKPYMIMWVWGTKELPFKEIVLAKLVFKVSPDVNMDDELHIDLSYNEENKPSDLKGNAHSENVEITETPSTPIEDIVESFPEFQPKSAFILEKVNGGGRILTLALYIDPSESAKAKAVSLEIVCPSGIEFSGAEPSYAKDAFAGERNMLSWNLTDGNVPADKTLLAMISLTVNDDVDSQNPSVIAVDVKSVINDADEDITSDFVSNGYTFDPETEVKSVSIANKPAKVKRYLADNSFDFADGTFELIYRSGAKSEPISMSECTIINYSIFENDMVDGYVIEHDFAVEYEDIIFNFRVPYVYSPGDVNNDEAINLSDVTEVLKHIAKWDVSVNADAADANGDESVNLSDVTLLLQYIAKWNVSFE